MKKLVASAWVIAGLGLAPDVSAQTVQQLKVQWETQPAARAGADAQRLRRPARFASSNDDPSQGRWPASAILSCPRTICSSEQ